MIPVPPEVQQRIQGQYDELCRQVGTRKSSVLLDHLLAELPLPVVIDQKPAHDITDCTVTGRAWTGPDAAVHRIEIASELRGSAREHTMVHEVYHLAFHQIGEAPIDEMVDYYLTMPQFAALPRSIVRAMLLDSINQPMHRNGAASLWEQEAEAFATLVVCNSGLITRPPAPKRGLLAALGDIYA